MALKIRQSIVRGLGKSFLGLAVAGLTLPLAGCGAFFSCEGKASCGTTTAAAGTTASSGDYAYVSNSTSGITYIDGFELSTGVLEPISGFPTSLAFQPTAMVINPANTYLFVASTTGGIYSYAISSSGALQVTNSGNPIITGVGVDSMAISPDGQWLFAPDTASFSLHEYNIQSGGALVIANSIQLSTTSVVYSVTVAPNAAFVALALGAGGTNFYSFTTSNGALPNGFNIPTASTTSDDFAVAMDKSNNLFVARTGQVVEFAVTSTGGATVIGTGAAAGAPQSIALNNTYAYAYAGNPSVGTPANATISNFSVPIPAAGGTIAAPADVGSLAVDNTGKYLVAAGYNSSNGIQMFTIGTAGALTLNSGSVGTGTATNVSALLALTH